MILPQTQLIHNIKNMKYNIQRTTVKYFRHSDGSEVFFKGKFSHEPEEIVLIQIKDKIESGEIEIIEKDEDAFVEEVTGHVVPLSRYKQVRKYPVIGEQLDVLWHDINNGVLGESAKESQWYKDIKEIKDTHPKTNP
jgi:hypothetical protein